MLHRHSVIFYFRFICSILSQLVTVAQLAYDDKTRDDSDEAEIEKWFPCP